MVGEALIKILGDDNIILEQEILEAFSRDMSFVSPVKPKCVVKAHNVDEINKLVNFAKETMTPLVPVSSGPPHFRGDTVPGLGGAIIVDLSDMKKIIKIDRLHRTAMIEAGVTFSEAIPALEKEGLRMNIPLLPRKSKSIVGSMLEREPVILPGYHWDIADPLNCIEIVFGTGDIFRTGSAAGPGTVEEQWASGQALNEAAGPTQASWYRIVQGAQGTLGIVPWASIRCEILPSLEEPFLVGTSQIDRLLEMLHWILRLRLVDECFLLNNSNMAAIMAKKWPDDYQEIKESLPPYILFFNIAGYDYLPDERVSYQTKDMMNIAGRVGLEPKKLLGQISSADFLETIKKPSEEPYWKLRYKGGCHDIFFISTIENLPELIGTMYDTADEASYPASDIGIYIQPIVQGSNYHCEFNLFYDPDNPRETYRIKELSDTAIKKLMNKGAFFSRPYGESAGMIINRDAATAATLKKIKAMFDPKNIMNPGKLCF